jgi:tol-pal system protein YbgF
MVTMTWTAKSRVVMALVGLFWPVAVSAQQPAPGAQAAPPAQGTAAQRTVRTPPKETQAAPVSGGGSDAALRKRVEQLEEQLVDLQVVIGTLESLAKAPAKAAGDSSSYRAPPASSAADTARIDGLEMQIRALTQQMEQLSAEVRGRAAGQGTANLQPGPGALRPDAAIVAQPQGQPAPQPGGNDPIEGILSTPLPPVEAPSGTQTAALNPSEDPKAAYEAAYGHMLQQNYGAAQAGFGDFLKRYPTHALVPNALYWLGESYYVQRNYADATEAFDIVLSAHAASNKAPDSQLKKAMSLAQQGKNADACSALRQLAVKYPNAPSHVKSKADSERRRVGCT